MNEVLIEITPALVGLIGTLFTAVVGYLATKIKAYLDIKKAEVEMNMDLKKQEQLFAFVKQTVLYVNQVATTLDASVKLAMAQDKIIAWANEKDIPITDKDLDLLIESTVNAVKTAGN